MPIALATGDPEPGGLPPVFTAICLVVAQRASISLGTGFFVGERASVVTARHVLFSSDPNHPEFRKEPTIFVLWVLNGRHFLFTARARVVREHPATDLALLRVENADEFPRPLTLDSLTSLSPTPAMPRDFVCFDSFQCTSPGGFERLRVWARVKQIEEATSFSLPQRLLTLDAAAWPGASGSPVFNKSGEVIGVLTGCRKDTGEAMVRDGRWLRQLFREPRPATQRQATVIPFSPLSFAPYMHAPWWSPWQRLGSRMFSYLGRPWIP